MEDISRETIIKASQGDMQAFEELYKASSSFVYNVALRVVNNREDALELSQEVFMIIHQKLKNFRFESSFKTWAYRITANTAINFAKKNSRAKTVPYEDAFGEASVLNEAPQQMDQEHQSQLVENLLGELNPDQRACVVLRDIQGLSYEEIAQALNININTVRSRLKKVSGEIVEPKKDSSGGKSMIKKCEQFKDLILTDYVDGQLDKKSIGELEDHLLDCGDCRAFLVEVKNTTALPFQKVLRQEPPVELWETIKKNIEYEDQKTGPIAELIDKLRTFIFFPRLVPVFASFMLMFLVGSVTLNTMHTQELRANDQGEYLVSLLNPTAPAASDSNDLGTPIEHYFL